MSKQTTGRRSPFARACAWLGVLCLLALVATWPVRAWYASSAVLAQRVDYNPALAALTGSPGNPIGSPQRIIVRDPAAFLEGKSPEGARYLNDGYLKENGIYPLQLKTVDFAVGVTRAAAGAAAIALMALSGWLARRSR